MAFAEIPIGQGVYKNQNARSLRNSPYAENLINSFIDPAGANFDRPTLALKTTLDSTDPIGMTYFRGVLVVVTNDRKIYKVENTTVTDITGVTLEGVERPTFADNGSTLIIAGGGAPLKWAGGANTTALLGGSPPDMTHVVNLDGFIIGNRRLDSENNKVMQFCDFEAIETWPATNIFSHVADPDELQGLIVANRELHAVGVDTTEVWQNVGTSPVPFARAFVWQYGTPAKYSIGQADGSVFFIDQDRRILRITGRQIARVSEAIENELYTYSTVADCWSQTFTWKGAVHMFFCFPTAGRAWSLDLRNNQWSEWYSYDNGLARVRINCMVYEPSVKTVWAGDFTTGKIFTFSDTIKTDAGGIFVRLRTLSERDAGGGVRKRANMVRFNIRRDVASGYTGETSDTNPQLELRWRDDGKAWSDWRRASLGEIGEQRKYVEFHRLGVYKSRKYEYRLTDPAELNVISMETDETVMAR